MEKKARELEKDVKLLRMKKGKMEEEEEEEEEKEEEEKGEEKEQEKEGDNTGQEDDTSDIESDTSSSTLLRTSGHKYALRQREANKFSNTVDTLLILTPSPQASPQPTTPVHVFSPPAMSRPSSPN